MSEIAPKLPWPISANGLDPEPRVTELERRVGALEDILFRALAAAEKGRLAPKEPTDAPDLSVALGSHLGGLPERGLPDVSGRAAPPRLPGPDRPPRPPRQPKDREWDGS